MSEKAGYRDNLARIDAAFPDKETLTKSDIAKFEGLHWQTVAKRYKFNQFGCITKSDWARQATV